MPFLSFTVDPKTQYDSENDSGKDSTYALPEKTKRGPPTNKNISVRNIKAHIANMSANENACFKREYHVWIILTKYIFIVYQIVKCACIVKLMQLIYTSVK